jgi:hypothetical protein
MAADKLQESEREALKLALEALETERDIYREHDEDGAPEYILEAVTAIKAALAQPAQSTFDTHAAPGKALDTHSRLPQPAQETEMLTIAYYSGYHDGKKAALAGREWNFCERCGKRTADKTVIHTCTPPQEKNNG